MIQQPVIVPALGAAPDFKLIGHRDTLAKRQREGRNEKLVELLQSKALTVGEYNLAIRILSGETDLSGEETKLLNALCRLLDGERGIDYFRDVYKDYVEFRSNPAQPPPEPQRPAAVSLPAGEHPDKEPAGKETPVERTSRARVIPWGNLITACLAILFFGFMGYSAIFGPETSMLVLDLDWEPHSPKPGEAVIFTAKYAGTYTVREIAGGYWPRKKEVEGKRTPHTFKERWSIGGNDSKNDRVEVLESGRATTSQVTNAFDRPGRYTVRFSIDVVRKDNRNEIIRTITVVDDNR